MVDSVGKSKNSKHNNLTLGPFVSIRWTFPSTNFMTLSQVFRVTNVEF